MTRLTLIGLLLFSTACAHGGPDGTELQSSIRVQAAGSMHSVTAQAAERAHRQLGRAGAGLYHFDIYVQRNPHPDKIVYEARLIVSDATSSNLRHIVRTVASAPVRRRGLSADLEQTVVGAATEQAAREAMRLIRGDS